MSVLSRRDLLKLLVGASAAPVLLAAGYRVEAGPWDLPTLIRSRIRTPVIPDLVLVITEFGAVGDGRTDCSTAIADAIAAANAAGGGRVVVPKGVFLTGPVHLESHIELHLERGATLAFIPDPERYLPAVFTRWEGVEFMGLSPLIYAFGKTDVAITGEGTLDGGADETHWWPWKGAWKGRFNESAFTQNEARNRLLADAEAGVPPEERHYAEGAYFRPPFIQLYRCQNILVEGVTIVRSPFWLIHPVLSTSVTVRGVSCRSFGPNNDGCDPESCQDVLIERCVFDTGDDCIAIKSGRNADGRRVGVASENIIVSNCEMKAGHGGVVMGSELSGGIRNVFVENCRMSSPDLERGIRIKTNAMRGGGVENLNVRGLEVGKVRDLIVVNFHYEEAEVGPWLPLVRDIAIENVHCADAERVLDLRGFERAPIQNVRLADITVDSASKASRLEYVEGLAFERVTVNGVPVARPDDLMAGAAG